MLGRAHFQHTRRFVYILVCNSQTIHLYCDLSNVLRTYYIKNNLEKLSEYAFEKYETTLFDIVSKILETGINMKEISLLFD